MGNELPGQADAPTGFPFGAGCRMTGPCRTTRSTRILPAELASLIGDRTEELVCAAALVLARKYADGTAFCLGIRRTTWSPADPARDLVATMPSSLRASDHVGFVAAALRTVRAPEPERGGASEIVCVLDGPAPAGTRAALVLSHERSREGGLALHADADEHTFGALFVQRMLGHLEHLLGRLCADGEPTIGELRLTPDAELEGLRALSRTDREYPRDTGLYQLFAEQAEARPDGVAVSHAEGTTSYRRLRERAEELAGLLRARGVAPGRRVAFLLERTPLLPALMLAVVRLGASYVPLDVDTPAERRAFLLEDSGACLLVTDDPRVTAAVPVLDLTAPREEPEEGEDERPLPPPSGPRAEAYVMYTSGTTGRPKGVMIGQRAVVRLVRGTDFVDLSRDSRILQTGALAFDATTFEFWGALLNGGTVVLVPGTTVLSAVELRAAVERHGVNLMFLTATLFNQLVDQDPTALAGCHVLVGGEALSPGHVARALEACPTLTLANAYGPTENTTFSVVRRVAEAGSGRIPIGRPIANSTAWVLDRDLNPQPLGVPGELCVGGDGLSGGYLNRPELDRAAFVTAPGIDGRLYRTGDRAAWTEEGLLDYLGRADDQVKIRGYRVEPAEIEVRLGLLPEVREAAVVLSPQADGIASLRAFFTAGSPLDTAALTGRLAELLPAYMVPGSLQQVAVMPRTHNHKIDRAALLAIPLPASPDPDGRGRAPRTELEVTVAAAFAEVLGVESVSLDDDFFDLGGHSLRMMRLWNRIRSVTGVPIELARVLDAPTVAGIAALLERGGSDGPARPRLARRS
ncbi:non-ribosomal peptide synthetase [Streptomyces sp. NPDC048606]|uniref:non-ribosomal peptide synthetase n=1 Tax=Streptomyces sp. NPDC048606 TaxID=3154726 RepID=UPI0034298008